MSGRLLAELPAVPGDGQLHAPEAGHVHFVGGVERWRVFAPEPV
jgi:hypothetical protein